MLGLYEHPSFHTSRLRALLPIVPSGIMYSTRVVIVFTFFACSLAFSDSTYVRGINLVNLNKKTLKKTLYVG